MHTTYHHSVLYAQFLLFGFILGILWFLLFLLGDKFLQKNAHMEFVASYVLLSQNNKEPTAENISMLLNSISATVDKDALNEFMKKIEGKSYTEIMQAGASMMTLQNVSSTPAASAGNEPAKAAKQEEEEEDDLEIDLF